MQNGATIEEAASALVIANRLIATLNLPEKQQPVNSYIDEYEKVKQEINKKSKIKENKFLTEMDKFKIYRSLGTLSQNAEIIDWDLVAGTILTHSGWQE